MLSPIIRHHFSSREILEGAGYARSGAVKYIHSDDDRHHFRVQGTADEPYDVYVDCNALVDRELDVACSCPRFQDVGKCKHLWAMAVAFDRRKLEVPSRPKRARLVSCEMDEIHSEIYDRVIGGGDIDDRSSSSSPEHSSAVRFANQVIRTMSFSKSVAGRSPAPPPGNPQPAWARSLEAVRLNMPRQHSAYQGAATQPWYAINVARSLHRSQLAVDLFERQLQADGSWGKPRHASNRNILLATAPTAFERELATRVWEDEIPTYSWSKLRHKPHELNLDADDSEWLLPRLAATGRLVWLLRDDQPWDAVLPLQWDASLYEFVLLADRTTEKGGWLVRGGLATDSESPVAPMEDLLLSTERIVLFADRVGLLSDPNAEHWISKTAAGPWHVKDEQRGQFLSTLAQISPQPINRFPSEFCTVSTANPVPVLNVDMDARVKGGAIVGQLSFAYGANRVKSYHGQDYLVDETLGVIYTRNLMEERRSASFLQGQKVHANGYWDGYSPLRIAREEFSGLIKTLAEAGWVVEANQQSLRVGGQLKLNVTSSPAKQIDWFDLEGQVEFEGGGTTLPKLLSAIRQGERTIRLNDGSVGLMPEEWMQRFGRLADLGDVEDGKLRFQSSQALLLDALLSSDLQATVDKGFRQIRERLQETHLVKALNEPKGFGTKLRDYQKQGQGWLSCLHELNLGACLADDMGLGKTVQVISWLETLRIRRKKADEHRPSLVVVPKSLVFNWVAECMKFAPKLRVLNYTGKERIGLEDLSEIDLVVTTYGTMRLDIEKLREIEFDYLILDEAQAIKNANAQAAKAARLLKGRHRLAMSGTPIENHLGELWSLFEFINPGLLGNSTAFQRVARGAAADPESVQWLSKAIAPFVMRRTKKQVLTELPEKSEQIIYCEMSPKHRKLYNELRDHYRTLLSERVQKEGLAKSKIIVLEALLRLRQAACHPGLLDEKSKKELGPKLEELVDRLRELTDEGHKTLVFSQFTSFLEILKLHLKKEQIPFLYLDGQTSLRERESLVNKFQNGGEEPVFLISLKAGGSGLNLTAADYVFLLDPWWNPAVENQAIDRTHRIGQNNKVHACRLITKDTVEEKVLQLQQKKKALSEAILSIDGSLLRKLSWDDLRILFE